MSDKVLELLKQIEEKQSGMQVSVKAAQTLSEEVKAGHLENKEALAKALADSEKAMAQIGDLKGQIESISKTAEYMEKSIARMGEVTGQADEELEAKAHDEMCRFLRHGTELSDEVKTAVAHSMTSKMFHGLSDGEKDRELKALIAGSNPDGGYFIRPERSAKMIQRIFETSPVRRLANVVTTASDSIEFIIDDNEASSGGWVGETDTRSETNTAQIGKLIIPVHEQYAQPLATQKMLDDAGFDIESWLATKTTGKMSRIENTAFVVGTGALSPKGFLDYAAWASAGVYERNKLEQLMSGAAADVTANGLKGLQNSLIEEYQANAKFVMKRNSFLNVITLKGSDGQYIFQNNFINGKDELRLLGKEIVFMNDMPAIAADALAVAYGDFMEGYTVVDRLGFRVIRDVYTQKPYIKFYTTKRVGGAVTNFEAIKVLKMHT